MRDNDQRLIRIAILRSGKWDLCLVIVNMKGFLIINIKIDIGILQNQASLELMVREEFLLPTFLQYQSSKMRSTIHKLFGYGFSYLELVCSRHVLLCLLQIMRYYLLCSGHLDYNLDFHFVLLQLYYQFCQHQCKSNLIQQGSSFLLVCLNYQKPQEPINSSLT